MKMENMLDGQRRRRGGQSERRNDVALILFRHEVVIRKHRGGPTFLAKISIT